MIKCNLCNKINSLINIEIDFDIPISYILMFNYINTIKRTFLYGKD